MATEDKARNKVTEMKGKAKEETGQATRQRADGSRRQGRPGQGQPQAGRRKGQGRLQEVTDPGSPGAASPRVFSSLTPAPARSRSSGWRPAGQWRRPWRPRMASAVSTAASPSETRRTCGSAAPSSTIDVACSKSTAAPPPSTTEPPGSVSRVTAVIPACARCRTPSTRATPQARDPGRSPVSPISSPGTATSRHPIPRTSQRDQPRNRGLLPQVALTQAHGLPDPVQ